MTGENGGRMAGMFGAGQRVTQVVTETSEREAAIRHTRDLGVRRILEVAFWALWVPLISGPWVLCWYIPVAFRYAVDVIGAWLGLVGERRRSREYIYRGSLVCIGLAVALGLLVLDDRALFWWPWRWQIPASTGRGLLWPGWWHAAIPSIVIVRVVLVVGPLRAAPELGHLDQRQRQQIRMPTFDGAAFDPIPAHLVRFRGWENPIQDPNAPAAPPSQVRAIFRRTREGNGGGTVRIIDCPEQIATLEQLRDLSSLVLKRGVRPTRPEMVTKRHLFTDPAWRSLQEWMASERLVEKAGSARSAAYELTTDGYTWLQTIAEGEHGDA